tara:strand:- start:980 stop:1507 length:528 start_codon:yes stop_codon:yes gene_type:complete
MKLEKIQIEKLKPASYNPRQITKKQYADLLESIKRFGVVDPIIVNQDFTVIGGHQRLKVCQDLNHKEIGCIILDLDKQQERELNIRLNKSGGEFDMDILANEFDISDLNDWGFTELELGLKTFDFEEEDIEDLSDTDKDEVTIQMKMPIEIYKKIDKEFNAIITTHSEIKCKVIN